jgi:predicted glycosyltransferase
MIKKLRKNNQVLCTSRNYREVVELAKVRKVKIVLVGRHGGSDKSEKLKASLERMHHLSHLVGKFAPDLTISFCSPEAARISFGIGIRHIAFSDSPHAEAVMRLSVPFVQKLLIPWVIPKKEFVGYGIPEKDIVQYRSIDAALIAKRKSKNQSKSNYRLKDKKTILVRVEESQAAYIQSRKNTSTNIIRETVKNFSNYNIVVLGRYLSDITQLKKEFGNKIIVTDKAIDIKALFRFTDVFIGSGGTMTAEAALMGIPTISYDAVPNHIEKYLVRIGLIRRERNSKKIIKLVKKILKSDNQNLRKKAKKILNSMEDPVSKLLTAIRSV